MKTMGETPKPPAQPGFVPAHTPITAPGATPARWMLVLHGILGSGANWRTFILRLAAARPEWGFLLVDQRLHGRSQGAPPPHTIEAAAEDLIRLGASIPLPIAGVMGHSFGGKVALAYTAAVGHVLDETWVLDASPGARHDRSSSTEAVLGALREVPQPLPSRERFFEIMASRGYPRAFAEWLAMNLRHADDGYRLRLDLDAVSALLDAYFSTDLWPVLERAGHDGGPSEGPPSPPGHARAFHVVVAGRSDAFDAADRARLAALAERDPRVHAHLIAEAGHWVHVDAPAALLALLSGALS
jgi:pimeloyl-ACP methyl ester carboxylesterase